MLSYIGKQGYRSGHNEAVLKISRPHHGLLSESLVFAIIVRFSLFFSPGIAVRLRSISQFSRNFLISYFLILSAVSHGFGGKMQAGLAKWS